MEIKFKPTSQDYWRFNLAQLKVPSIRKRMFTSILVFIGIFVIWGLLKGSNWIAIFRSLIIFIVLFVVLYYLMLKYRSSMIYKNNPAFFQEQTLIINEAGIRDLILQQIYGFRGKVLRIFSMTNTTFTSS